MNELAIRYLVVWSYTCIKIFDLESDWIVLRCNESYWIIPGTISFEDTLK